MTLPEWETLIFPTCRENMMYRSVQMDKTDIKPSWTNIYWFAVVPPWATFYTLLRKTQHRISVEFKTDAIGLEANLLNRSLFRFQICRFCTFGCPVLVQRNFALYLVVILLQSTYTKSYSLYHQWKWDLQHFRYIKLNSKPLSTLHAVNF